MLRARQSLPGEWESVFSGLGQQFAALKEFRPPASVSLIHIPTLARTGEVYIMERIPRRGVEVTFILDLSSSCEYGLASEIRDTALWLLWRGALEKENPLSILCFSDRVECFFTPDNPIIQAKRFERWREQHSTGERKKTRFTVLLPYVYGSISRGSLVFFISDFLEGDGLEEVIDAMRVRFDCVPVVIDTSATWRQLPSAHYRIEASDAEWGGIDSFVFTPNSLRELQEFHRARIAKLSSFFRTRGLPHTILTSSGSRACIAALTKCFRQKVRRVH